MMSQRRLQLAAFVVIAGAALALQFSPSAQACLECGSIRYDCVAFNTCLQMSQAQKQDRCDLIPHEQVCYAKCNNPCVPTTPGVKCAGGPAIECHYSTLPPPSECSTIQPCGSSLTLVSQTQATIPANRARLKLGVGEKVSLNLSPAPACAVTWQIVDGSTGHGSLSSLSGVSVVYTAHERAEQAVTVRATVNSIGYSKTFWVVEPDGITIQREPGTGLKHTFGTSSVGYKGRAWYSPTDVSFINIQVRERGAPDFSVPASAGGYYSVWNGLPHDLGNWFSVLPGTETMGSKDGAVDEIDSGQRNPPYSIGTFTWNIPWEFRVGTGAGKVFTTVTHQATATATGQTTICKGNPPSPPAGHCETRSPNDPTSSW